MLSAHAVKNARGSQATSSGRSSARKWPRSSARPRTSSAQRRQVAGTSNHRPSSSRPAQRTSSGQWMRRLAARSASSSSWSIVARRDSPDTSRGSRPDRARRQGNRPVLPDRSASGRRGSRSRQVRPQSAARETAPAGPERTSANRRVQTSLSARRHMSAVGTMSTTASPSTRSG